MKSLHPLILAVMALVSSVVRSCMLFAFPVIVLVACAGCARPHSVTVTPPAVTAQPSTPATPAPQSDPIDALVERLSSTHGLWVNGIYPKIDLPATASVQQVLERVFRMTGFDKGHVTTHRIIETRDVRIDGGIPDAAYTAVLVETDLGRKIVLLRPSPSPSGWWSRVYDA